MLTSKPSIADLLETARVFGAYGTSSFGYVEDGEVSLGVIRNAVITTRDYVDGPMRFVGAVYDGQNRLVRSSLGFSEGDFTPLDPDEIAPERRHAARHIKRAIYGGTLYSILGHFLFETVARLWPGMDFASRLGIGRGALPVIFHPWPGPHLAKFLRNPLYRQILGALAIRPRDIALATIDLSVETLYYPSPLSIYHATLHPMMGTVLDHLAEQLRPRSSSLAGMLRLGRPSTRIFLSRNRWAVHRRVRNEAALEDVFRAQGFRILHPQGLSPGDLIATLQNAEIVASTDGSQAHLVAFCRPGTRTMLIDTRPVPTQFAIEKLRQLRGFHLPVYSNGLFDEQTGLLDLSPFEELVATAIKDGAA